MKDTNDINKPIIGSMQHKQQQFFIFFASLISRTSSHEKLNLSPDKFGSSFLLIIVTEKISIQKTLARSPIFSVSKKNWSKNISFLFYNFFRLNAIQQYEFLDCCRLCAYNDKHYVVYLK